MRLFSLLVLGLLPACASITTGSSQSVAVDTSPERGASCQLTNDKGNWYLAQTPGSVTVNRSYSALTVACEKKELKGTQTVQSGTKDAAFGNILLGGIIGAGVDMSTGAAYDYPASITVPLMADNATPEATLQPASYTEEE